MSLTKKVIGVVLILYLILLCGAYWLYVLESNREKQFIELARMIIENDYDKVETYLSNIPTELIVNARSPRGRDLLSAAIQNGTDPRVINLVAQKGFESFDIDDSGQTYLHHAINAGNIFALKFLLNAGANPHVKNTSGESAFEGCSSVLRSRPNHELCQILVRATVNGGEHLLSD